MGKKFFVRCIKFEIVCGCDEGKNIICVCERCVHCVVRENLSCGVYALNLSVVREKKIFCAS